MDPRHYSLFLAITLATLFVVAILLYFVFRIIQKQQELLRLQRKVAKVEVATLEKERARIAGDLHDDIGPLLAAVKYRIEVVVPGTERDQTELSVCADHLNEAMVRLRKVTHNLLPAVLEKRGLTEAIQELAVSTEKLYPLKVELIADMAVPLNKENEIHLYRLVQEGIANCVQHAAASCLRIKLTADHRMLTLQLVDNGIGIQNKASVDDFRGRGLAGFRNRAMMLGGTFVMESEPDKGTALIFEIPLT